MEKWTEKQFRIYQCDLKIYDVQSLIKKMDILGRVDMFSFFVIDSPTGEKSAAHHGKWDTYPCTIQKSSVLRSLKPISSFLYKRA